MTYRLFGSLPRERLDELNEQRESALNRKPPPNCSPSQYRARVHKELFAAYDRYLDRAGAEFYLADPRIAAIIRSNLYHHHAVKCHLVSYCIMSNHVHVLLIPNEGAVKTGPARRRWQCSVGEQPDDLRPLAKIMHSLKSYTAHQANQLLGREGAFWQAESYDHWVRDLAELERIVDYICANPVKAGLVKRPEDWFFCSCHDRYLTDGEVSGLLKWES